MERDYPNLTLTDPLAVLRALGEAWAAGDAEAYGAVCASDLDYVDLLGNHYQGRQAVVDVHRWLFENLLKGTTLSDNAVTPKVVYLAEDVALVHTGGGSAKDGTAAEGVQTSVMVRLDGQWMLRAFQNTRRTPFPGVENRNRAAM